MTVKKNNFAVGQYIIVAIGLLIYGGLAIFGASAYYKEELNALRDANRAFQIEFRDKYIKPIKPKFRLGERVLFKIPYFYSKECKPVGEVVGYDHQHTRYKINTYYTDEHNDCPAYHNVFERNITGVIP